MKSKVCFTASMGKRRKKEAEEKDMADLEKMRVKDVIVYYLRNEKKEHTAHRDAIIEYVRSSQLEHVKKGYRTPSGLTSLMSKLKKVSN